MNPDKLIRRVDEKGIIYTSEDGKIFKSGEQIIEFEILRRQTKKYVPKEWLSMARQWWDYIGYDKRQTIVESYYDTETCMDCKFARNYYLNVEPLKVFIFWLKADFPILEITYPFKNF
jgi:hypothetical protein